MVIEDIFDMDELYRRFPRQFLKDDGTLSTAAFQNTSRTTEMSVDLARLTTPSKTALNNENYGVASFEAGAARQLDQEVYHNPTIENNAHSTVRGQKPRRIRLKLAEISKIVLLPKIK